MQFTICSSKPILILSQDCVCFLWFSTKKRKDWICSWGSLWCKQVCSNDRCWSRVCIHLLKNIISWLFLSFEEYALHHQYICQHGKTQWWIYPTGLLQIMWRRDGCKIPNLEGWDIFGRSDIKILQKLF